MDPPFLTEHIRLPMHRQSDRLLRLILLVAAACSRTAGADEPMTGPPLFDQTPDFQFSPRAPLAGTLSFSTHEPCAVTVRLIHGDSSAEVPIAPVAARRYSIPIVGLRPSREYSLLVTLHREGRSTESEPLAFTTSPLPDELPTLRVSRSLPDRMEPGVTLLSLFRWENDKTNNSFGAFVAVDAAGEVVWYHLVGSPAAAIRRLENGNFMFIHGVPPTNIREIDRLGNTVRDFEAIRLSNGAREGAIAVDVDTFHHDFFPLDAGHLLALTTEVRRLERFPLNLTRPGRSFGPANVVGDVVVELAADGDVVNRWPLLDILDSSRVTWGSHDSFWNDRAYPHVEGGTFDWSHTNAIVRDPKDGGLILSLRHQDAIVKLDAATSEVKWILGSRGGWRRPLSDKVLKPASRLEWPFHSHGVKLTPHGTLLLFDNGNLQAIPPAHPIPPTEARSRAVEFFVDEAAMTLTQVWSYGGPGSEDRFYSPFLGDADWLPQTGNVLITDGARVTDADGQPLDNPPGNMQWARILEVTHDDPAEIVWELLIDDRFKRPHLGWSAYRAERLPDLGEFQDHSPEEWQRP